MMTAKIKIRMGQIEIEYEGPEAFLRDELKELLSGVVELHREHDTGEPEPVSSISPSRSDSSAGGSSTYVGTTNTFAAKLGVRSGTDLIIAAMAQKTLVGGVETVPRSEILREMQSASSYYKKSYRGNLTGYLKTLVTSDRLREVSKDTYSLSAAELEKVKASCA